MSSGMKFAIAIAAVVVVAVVGINLLPSAGVTGVPSASTPTPTQPTVTPEPAVTPHSSPLPASGPIEPGRYFSAQPRTLVQVTLPAGWSAVSDEAIFPSGSPSIWRSSLGERRAFLALGHEVKQVVTDICVVWDQEQYVDIGPTAGDLVSALEAQIAQTPEEALAEPADVMVGGYPARKFVLTYPMGCPGPEGRYLWTNGSPGSGEGVLKADDTTIYIVDVDGDRQVITSSYPSASAADRAELDAIVASIEIEPAGVYPTGLIIGRQSLTVEGLPLSFAVPEGISWERFGSISLNRSTHGPQDAEGMLYWTGFPDGAYADPCGLMSSLPVGSSVADLAAAVATARGTELVGGPTDVTVGGHPATHVVVTVRQDVGCDPGYFFTWQDAEVGALWPTTDVGDTIMVWIVDVDGTRLFIAGETHRDSGPGVALTDAERRALQQQIQQIVDSIQFE